MKFFSIELKEILNRIEKIKFNLSRDEKRLLFNSYRTTLVHIINDIADCYKFNQERIDCLKALVSSYEIEFPVKDIIDKKI
jgi:hypothetical protein